MKTNGQSLLEITLVIPTRNRPNDLMKTLLSFLSQHSLPNEIIVVDQSSPKQAQNVSEEISRIRCLFPNVLLRLLSLDQPSLTKARNVALRQAKNNIVLFSDDDVLLLNDALQTVFELMNRPNCAMVGGLNANDYLSRAPRIRSLLSCFIGRRSLFHQKQGSVTKAIYGMFPQRIFNGEVDTRWAMGFFFSVKKDLSKKWGLLFDEKLTAYAYAEDLDFSYRYWQQSKKEHKECLISSRLQVNHYGSSANRLPNQALFTKECVNRLYLSYKLFPKQPLSRVAYSWANFCTAIRLLGKKELCFWIKACQIARSWRRELKSGCLSDDCYYQKR